MEKSELRVIQFRACLPQAGLCEITKKSPSKSFLKRILGGPTWNRTKHLLPRRIGGVFAHFLVFLYKSCANEKGTQSNLLVSTWFWSGPTWNRTKHLLPRRIGGVSCSVLSFVDQKLQVFGHIFEFSYKNLAFHSFDKHFHFSSMRNWFSLYAKV